MFKGVDNNYRCIDLSPTARRHLFDPSRAFKGANKQLGLPLSIIVCIKCVTSVSISISSSNIIYQYTRRSSQRQRRNGQKHAGSEEVDASKLKSLTVAAKICIHVCVYIYIYTHTYTYMITSVDDHPLEGF